MSILIYEILHSFSLVIDMLVTLFSLITGTRYYCIATVPRLRFAILSHF